MTNELPKPVFLSAPKAATLCGVTRNTVCVWIRQGRLSSYQTAGGKNLIRPVDLIDFMEAHHMFVPDALREMAATDGLIAESPERQTTSAEPAILIIDDLKDARKLASTCLRKLNMPILEAEDGYQAMHVLMKHPEVAVVVLDLMMPGQSGAETLREMRGNNLQMPVIVVTGYASDEAKEMFETLEPDSIISKPYKPLQLVDAVQSLLAA